MLVGLAEAVALCELLVVVVVAEVVDVTSDEVSKTSDEGAPTAELGDVAIVISASVAEAELTAVSSPVGVPPGAEVEAVTAISVVVALEVVLTAPLETPAVPQ